MSTSEKARFERDARKWKLTLSFTLRKHLKLPLEGAVKRKTPKRD